MTSFQFRFISPFTYTPNRPKSCTQTCNQNPAEPRINSRKFSLQKTRGEIRPIRQNLKVANRSFSVVETLSGGSSKRIHARAAGGMIMPPKGSTQRGAPLGDSFGDFLIGEKVTRGTGLEAPPRGGVQRTGRSPSSHRWSQGLPAPQKPLRGPRSPQKS